MEALRVALVGVSGFGRVHFNDLIREHDAGNWQAIAATVINQDDEPEACAALRERGCTLYTDYGEMLAAAGPLDLVLIPTGIHLHRPMTEAALAAGANVYLEKPVAGHIREIDPMLAAEVAAGRKVWVGFQRMFDPLVWDLKRELLDGRYGAVHSVRCWGLWPRDAQYYARNGWAGALEVNGVPVYDSPMNNAMAHHLMLSLFFAGSELGEAAALVDIHAELYRVNPIDSADTCCFRGVTAAGIELSYQVSHACLNAFGPAIEITTDSGVITWQHGRPDSLRWQCGEDAVERLGQGGGELRPHIAEVVSKGVRGEDDQRACRLSLASAHGRCVSAVHAAAGDIVTITPEHWQQLDDKRVITGIDEAWGELGCSGRLPREAGLSWALG